MRDKGNYRAANTRAQGAVSDPFPGLPGAGNPMPSTIRPPVPYQEGPDRSRDPTSGPGGSMRDQSIGMHTNGIDTIPMECIRNGMQWYPLQCKPLHTSPLVTTVGCSGPG